MAREVDAKTIIFAVSFIRRKRAKILNPNKTVLMPDMSADCPMAHMAQVEKIEEMRGKSMTTGCVAIHKFNRRIMSQ